MSPRETTTDPRLAGSQSSNPRPNIDKGQALLGTATIAGTALFVALIAALHILNPNLDPFQRPTAEYVVGPYGFVMTTAFIVLSLTSWTLVLGFQRDLPPGARSRPGMVLLGIWAVGVLVAAAFPADLEDAPRTLAGTIHNINGPITFLSLVVGTNLVSRRLRHDPRWHPFSTLLSVLAGIMAIEFIANGLAAATETYGGLTQRILIVTLAAWLLVAAWRLRKNADENLARHSPSAAQRDTA